MNPLLRITLTGLMAVALAAPAQARSMSYKLQTVVQGKQKPVIILAPDADVKSVVIALTPEDEGKTKTLKSGRIRGGKTKKITIPHKKGFMRYTAAFEVTWGDGALEEFTTAIDVSRCEPLRILMGPGDVKMDAGEVRMKATNRLTEGSLSVLGDNGRRLRHVDVDFDPHQPGTYLDMAWDPTDEEVLRVEINVTDICGATYLQRIMPFTIEIPHEEVVFQSGKHQVRKGEEPKLQTTIGHINKALAKHGTLLQLKLYIGGCTDTVGARAANQALSERRARAISSWLTKNGLPRSLPVYYRGFGEDLLKKPTPDETDELANRRALYILSSQPPTIGGKTGSWKRL